MFLVNGIRRLLSLPLVVLGHVLNMLSPPIALALLRAAYAVGPEPLLGQMCLAVAYRVLPRPQAREIARTMCEKRFAVEPAVFWGLAEVADDPANARALLDRCRQFPPDRLGLVELLEMTLVDHENGDVAAVAKRLESRRDLSPQVSKMVQLELAWQDILQGNPKNATARAHRILEIEDDAQAEMILWALATATGHRDEAARHLPKAQSIPESHRQYYLVLVLVGLGRADQAQSLIEALRPADPALADKAQRFLLSKRENGRVDFTTAGVREPAAGPDGP